MPWSRRRKVAVAVFALLLAAGLGVAWALREEPPDQRFTGAYQLDDGTVAVVYPYSGDELRLLNPVTGELRPLVPRDEERYAVGERGTPIPPAEQRAEEVSFRRDGEGRVVGFVREGDSGGPEVAEKLPLREERFQIRSGALSLRAKLVLPEAARFSPPYPAAVVVHGSGTESAVDYYDDPYLWAAHGIATLVYDKRGTGGSEGGYTQNFHVLAGDVVAAVEALRRREDVDPGAIHLVGYSQGGWIAPLAASRGPGVASLVIGYGPMVPVVDEDRWGYVYALREKGFGEREIAAADRIQEVLVDVIDRGRSDRWGELGDLLDAARAEPWFQALAGSDSALGFLSAQDWVPTWMLRAYARWMMRPIDGEPFIDRLYDPVPVVASLDVPSLWIFGGDDHSMPTEWTVAELEALRERGAPIDVLVYPEADHGILLFSAGEDGERRFAGYPPGYPMVIVDRILARSG